MLWKVLFIQLNGQLQTIISVTLFFFLSGILSLHYKAHNELYSQQVLTECDISNFFQSLHSKPLCLRNVITLLTELL